MIIFRKNVINIILLLLALIISFILVGYQWKKYSNDQKIILYDKPIWNIGDWFEIEITKRNVDRSSSVERRAWSPVVRKRYRVDGTTNLFGYDCYILRLVGKWEQELKENMSWPEWYIYRGNQSRPDPTPKEMPQYAKFEEESYLFRCADMKMIAIVGSPGYQYSCQLPPWLCTGFGWIPSFPIINGHHRYAVTSISFPIQKKLPDNYGSGCDIGLTYNQIAWSESRTIDGLSGKFIHMQVMDDHCLWKKGQIWWAQQWDTSIETAYPSRRDGSYTGSTFRAILYRTSRDGYTNDQFPQVNKKNKIFGESIATRH